MITPMQVYRAKQDWRVGWFAAWAHLRTWGEYWKQPRAGTPYLALPDRPSNVT